MSVLGRGDVCEKWGPVLDDDARATFVQRGVVVLQRVGTTISQLTETDGRVSTKAFQTHGITAEELSKNGVPLLTALDSSKQSPENSTERAKTLFPARLARFFAHLWGTN